MMTSFLISFACVAAGFGFGHYFAQKKLRAATAASLAASKRAERYALLSDDEIAVERAKYEKDLDRLTGGRSNEAYMKANSIRFLWKEQIRRKGAPV